jgi:putative ABC transport system permease protein
MLKNYMVVAIRNIKKTKLFSFINILGLAVGVCAFLLIWNYVNFEKSYDNYHPNNDRIYRLRYERTSEDGSAVRFASCCPPAGKLIREHYPEVEKIARIFRYRAIVSHEETKFLEERMYFAEPDFFEIFNYLFIKGDPLQGINEPNTTFISEYTARKYFGEQDAVGKIISVDKKYDYKIVGIFKDVPQNSHLKIDIILSFKNLLSQFGPQYYEAWGHTGMYTYILLNPEADPWAFEEKLTGLVDSEFGEVLKEYNMILELKMQPLRDIHLNSHFMQEYEINGDADSVTFLLIIAFFIIIMAWVNYVNLSTARSLTRAKEVGLRKVVGASRGTLALQFFFETIIINIVAIFIALGILDIFRPLFTQITGTPLQYDIWANQSTWITILVLFVVGVLLSGFYPALILSSFNPSMVLKGKLGGVARGLNLRKGLVIFQFVIALLLIAGTFAVYRQLLFMKSQDLGFDIEQTMVLKMPRVRDETFTEKIESLKSELKNHSTILNTCVATEVPGRQIYWDAGGIHKAGTDISESKNYQIVGIDYDFANFFNLEFAAGRNYSKEFSSDKEALILNETAVKWMGFKSAEAALNQQVDYWGEIYTIIGVLKDYHQRSLKEAFEPHIYRLTPYGRDIRGVIAVKLNPQNISETVQLVQNYYEKFFPGNPVDYFFLDEYFNQQYLSEGKFGKVFGIFSVLAIFVTSLGILGLSSFMAVQRTKEIGIRKVLGANILRILLLLTRDFLFLLFVSICVALPVLFFGIYKWLQGFAYRMDVSIWLFIIPVLVIAVITLCTVSYQTLKSALSNPVDVLRYE